MPACGGQKALNNVKALKAFVAAVTLDLIFPLPTTDKRIAGRLRDRLGADLGWNAMSLKWGDGIVPICNRAGHLPGRHFWKETGRKRLARRKLRIILYFGVIVPRARAHQRSDIVRSNRIKKPKQENEYGDNDIDDGTQMMRSPTPPAPPSSLRHGRQLEDRKRDREEGNES